MICFFPAIMIFVQKCGTEIEIKGIGVGKGKLKLSLFGDNLIAYIENLV